LRDRQTFIISIKLIGPKYKTKSDAIIVVLQVSGTLL